MRQLILNLAVTLDGFIEGPNGEYDWCYTDQDYGMTNFLQRTDAIFFGRKSYELLLSTDANAYPEKKKYVFSNSMKTISGNAEIVSGDGLEKKVNAIKNENGKDIWLFGGAQLVTALMNADLVDELQLAIHPLLLGNGKPLFRNINERKKFRLADTITYSSGLVQLIYTR